VLERALRVAVVDSGINPNHPHVEGVAGGVGLGRGDDDPEPDWNDRLGHGTAVAAAIKQWAPSIELYAVRVFDRSFSTEIDDVVRGLRWCAQSGMDVVNLSLATLKDTHRSALETVSREVPVLVAPYDFAGIPAYPGSLDWVFGVSVGRDLEGDAFAVIQHPNLHFAASPLPRQLDDLPVGQNFSGPSFATANFTGHICRLLLRGDVPDAEALRTFLTSTSTNETDDSGEHPKESVQKMTARSLPNRRSSK